MVKRTNGDIFHKDFYDDAYELLNELKPFIRDLKVFYDSYIDDSENGSRDILYLFEAIDSILMDGYNAPLNEIYRDLVNLAEERKYNWG